ncbi:hypothetical protein [Paenibacillus swuensis]|uniref:hypothetical protein n=1 Tax=Paenibacillus swuensis TaxID=1178515 RepID=UPI000B0AB52C|nr:hypothetical protein [Paenibacillus swuensis]
MVKGKGKAAKKKEMPAGDKSIHNMRVVGSDTCAVCKTQCARGLKYLARMSEPGVVGKGVPCILTKGRAYK